MYLIRAIFHNLIQFRAMESCMDVFARSKFKLAGMKEAMKEKYLKKMFAAGEKNHKQKWSFNGFCPLLFCPCCWKWVRKYLCTKIELNLAREIASIQVSWTKLTHPFQYTPIDQLLQSFGRFWDFSILETLLEYLSLFLKVII